MDAVHYNLHEELDQSIQTTTWCHPQDLPIHLLRSHLHHSLLLKRYHYSRNHPKQPGCPLFPHHELWIQLCLLQCQPVQLRKTSLHQGKIEQYLWNIRVLYGKIDGCGTGWDLNCCTVHSSCLFPMQFRQQCWSVLQIATVNGTMRLHEFWIWTFVINYLLWCWSCDGFSACSHHPFPLGWRFLRSTWDSLRHLLSFWIPLNVQIWLRGNGLLSILKQPCRFQWSILWCIGF